MEIIQARAEIFGEYELQYNNWMLANGWLNGKFANDFTHGEKEYLIGIKNSIQTNMEMLRNAGLWCFSDLTVCLDKKQQAFDNLVDYDKLWLGDIKVVKSSVPVNKEIEEDYTFNFTVPAKFAKKNCGNQSKTICLPNDCVATGVSVKVHNIGASGGKNTPTPTPSGNKCYASYVEICANPKPNASDAKYHGTHTVKGYCPSTEEVDVLEVPPIPT